MCATMWWPKSRIKRCSSGARGIPNHRPRAGRVHLLRPKKYPQQANKHTRPLHHHRRPVAWQGRRWTWPCTRWTRSRPGCNPPTVSSRPVVCGEFTTGSAPPRSALRREVCVFGVRTGADDLTPDVSAVERTPRGWGYTFMLHRSRKQAVVAADDRPRHLYEAFSLGTGHACHGFAIFYASRYIYHGGGVFAIHIYDGGGGGSFI